MEDGGNDTARRALARHAAVVGSANGHGTDEQTDRVADGHPDAGSDGSSDTGGATSGSPRRFAHWLLGRAPGTGRSASDQPPDASAPGAAVNGAGLNGAGLNGHGTTTPAVAAGVERPRPRPRPHPTELRKLPPPPPPPPGSRPDLSVAPVAAAAPAPETAPPAMPSMPSMPSMPPAPERPRPRPRPGAEQPRRVPAEQPIEPAEQPTEPKPKRTGPSFIKRHGKLVRRVFRIGLVLALAIGAAVALRVWVVQPFYIPSQSMEPTLHGCPGCNDDRVLVDKLSYRSGDVSTHDIIVFNRPKTWQVADDVLVKRVIGLGGDRITVKSGFVYVNGLRSTEPFVNSKCGPHPTQPLGMRNPYTVPKGDVFVMGDNRCDSSDSRQNGPVPTADIIGRAFMIIWPVSRITTL